jgi:hypothetical protein
MRQDEKRGSYHRPSGPVVPLATASPRLFFRSTIPPLRPNARGLRAPEQGLQRPSRFAHLGLAESKSSGDKRLHLARTALAASDESAHRHLWCSDDPLVLLQNGGF